MKCPECQHEMVQSKAGYLCLNCGHADSPKPGDVAITPAGSSLTSVSAVAPEQSADEPAKIVKIDRQRTTKADAEAAPEHKETKSSVELTPSVDAKAPEPPAADKQPEPPAVDEPAEESKAPEVEVKPDPEPSVEPVADHAEPADEPKPSETEPAEVTEPPEPAPVEPPVVPTPEPSVTPEHVNDHASGNPAPVGQPTAVDGLAPAPAKPPVIAQTHPGSGPTKTIVAVIAAIVVVALAGGGYYAFASPSHPLSSLFGGASPSPSVAVSTTGGVSPSPSPSATPTPALGDAASRDAQRQADLAKYAAAYKATVKNGYYQTKPPTVSVGATDPTSGTAYQIVTTKPTTTGQVYYWAGGVCTGKPVTPGATSTHYLAVETILESQTAPYCLDVK